MAKQTVNGISLHYQLDGLEHGPV
ncbi:MAG: hypothetical protein JWP57_1558, partial [Spirosoma sp.]|nr:hypothetical protein [Spirosoma sp.]